MTDPGGLRRQLRRRRLAHWIATATRQIAEVSRAVIVIVGLLVAVALEVPWLQDPLKKLGLEDVTGITLSVITFLLVAIFFEVRSPIDHSQGQHETRHFPDAMDVYPILIDRINAISRREEKVLDVLGMTLYTAWPTLTFWLNRSELDNWSIRLSAAVEQPGDGLQRLVPEGWFRESRANLDDAARLAGTDRITTKGVRIETYAYDFVPVIHGFRLGNGDLFWSLLTWDADGRICRDHYSYEFIPHEDLSDSASATRAVFDSWFTRSCRTRWTPTGNT